MKTKIAIAVTAGALFMAAIGTSQTTKSVWDGIYTEDQAKRGQGAYNDQCGSCHGDQLTGGEMAPPLAGGEFLSNWNGLSVGELFDRIRTTMPLTRPGKLSREMNAEILAYMLQANKFPAGKTDMSGNSEVLKQIKLEAEKPSK
jgi:S-disulfanyl-L-cysteine oxidoreductase SoxD